MRLLNNHPISVLISQNISRNHFGLAKNFLSLGEKLKILEQKLLFFKRCKTTGIIPNFIKNNVRINSETLFPNGEPNIISRRIKSMRAIVLKHNTAEIYNLIRKTKYHIVNQKKELKSLFNQRQFTDIVDLFEFNNTVVKAQYKEKMKQKFAALSPLSPSSANAVVPASVPNITEESRVTTLGVTITANEEQFLALGPNFALSPRIDEKLLDTIRLNVAHTAYRLRWKAYTNSIHTAQTLYQHMKSSGCPFQRLYSCAPPTTDINLEDNLKQLMQFILKQYTSIKPVQNLTLNQCIGFKSLLNKRDTVHFSISDKGGEFVLLDKEVHTELTTNHITSSPDVYRYVPPSRQFNDDRGEQLIINTSIISFRRQIKSKTLQLESECNKLWSDICYNHNFEPRLKDLFTVHNSKLPTLYVLVKTHKFDAATVSTRDQILDTCKLRPIVSCCGSPTEKLSWICTTILSPLLNFVPSHLQNVYKHLDSLRGLTPDKIRGLKFFSADVVSLYTNIDIDSCITDIIDLAAEHIGHLNLRGITLTEVHQMLELVLSKSFFTFNNRLYLQTVGLFMGCMPSPLGAVIRMYNFIRRSIYIDTYYLANPVRLFFGIYMDDLGSLSCTKREAWDVLDRISKQDPRKLIKWELDFPESDQHFVPFLSTQIRVDEHGKLHYKYYRKPQKKLITLHSLSHHSYNTKIQTVKNFYHTAKLCSSNDAYIEESYIQIDKLLLANGYNEPRKLKDYRYRYPSKTITDKDDLISLSLPYLTETVSKNVSRFVNSHNLPIRVIFTPGRKLRDIFCNSRPLDKSTCFNKKCQICPRLVGGSDCTTVGVIYKIICNICNQTYIGETSRSIHERLAEHNRYAGNPTKHPDEALAVHYSNFHINITPDLSFQLLECVSSTVKRKIKEALYIINQKPEINLKEECITLERYLVK